MQSGFCISGDDLRRASSAVPVYSKNALSLQEKPLRHVSHSEAQLLLSEGKAMRVSRKGAPLKIQLYTLERIDRNSPTTITAREMQAFAGIGTPAEILRATEKVSAYCTTQNGAFEPSWADRMVFA